MSEQTRIVRLGAEVEREDATNEGTQLGLPIADWLSVPALFDAHHQTLAAALRAEPRPGMMVFALGPDRILGQLWLSATRAPRSGSIGRHSRADLFLPGEDRLSLRHCLVLVRRIDDGVRLHLIDLGSLSGMRTEEFQEVRALDADGHVFVHLPGGVLACFPTGAALPWEPSARRAFATLAPRKSSSHPEISAPVFRSRVVTGATHVNARAGPIVLGSDALCPPGEAHAGRLRLRSEGISRQVAVGLAALDQGVVLGRYSRCAGHEVFRTDTVSRVHALLLRRDGELILADVGSTNGIWKGDTELRCTVVEPGVEYGLGMKASIAWEPLQ